MPPALLALFLTASMPFRTSPRKLCAIPLSATVAPSLIWVAVTPVSVLPPFWPDAHASPPPPLPEPPPPPPPALVTPPPPPMIPPELLSPDLPLVAATALL